MRLRPAITLFAVIFLTACKVEITVPSSGGSVVSVSGANNCQPGETCILTIEEANFSDVFIAAPAPGYTFRGWRSGDSFLCGGASSNCPITTVGFDNFPALLAILTSDRSFFLQPVFKPKPTPDYNNDGYADLVITAPRETRNQPDGGLIQVVYGGENGLSASGEQAFDLDGFYQDSEQIGDLMGMMQADLTLGQSLASADFNSDGYTDLAVGGSNFEDRAGAVWILYGSEGGLSPSGHQVWTEDEGYADIEGDGRENSRLSDPPGTRGANHRFGAALAAGDFNNDNFADLAIGVPGYNENATPDSGAVTVLYGTNNGLSAQFSQQWRQDSSSISINGSFDDLAGDLMSTAESDDRFGSSVTAGDFNGDGYDELAIGKHGDKVDDVDEAGSVHVLMGTRDGLTNLNNLLITELGVMRDIDADGAADETLSGVISVPKEDERFGIVIHSDDFNGDGYHDLAVSVPFEDALLLSNTGLGIVQLYPGSAEGITEAGVRFGPGDSLYQGAPNGSFEVYGAGISSGDLDDDGYPELMTIGWIAGTDSQGELTRVFTGQIIPGSAMGLQPDDRQWLVGSQLYDSNGTPAWTPVLPDNAVGTLMQVAADYDGDGFEDMATGAYLESFPSRNLREFGAVRVFYSDDNGLNTERASYWTQDGGTDAAGVSLGDLFELLEADDEFGQLLH